MGTTGLTLADLPNIFIMIGALVALFVMLVILLRNMEVLGVMGDPREDWRRAMQPPRLLMQRVHIPFTFKLQDAPQQYSGVHCVTSSTVRYWYASWWGAPVSTLHRTLWGSLAEILNSPHMDFQGCLLRDQKLHYTQTIGAKTANACCVLSTILVIGIELDHSHRKNFAARAYRTRFFGHCPPKSQRGRAPPMCRPRSPKPCVPVVPGDRIPVTETMRPLVSLPVIPVVMIGPKRNRVA